jgi:cell division protein FtsL
MILCEYILIGTITASVITITGLLFGYYHSITSLVKQIKQLEEKVIHLNEQLKTIQMKVLDLNELSGLNERI